MEISPYGEPDVNWLPFLLTDCSYCLKGLCFFFENARKYSVSFASLTVSSSTFVFTETMHITKVVFHGLDFSVAFLSQLYVKLQDLNLFYFSFHLSRLSFSIPKVLSRVVVLKMYIFTFVWGIL